MLSPLQIPRFSASFSELSFQRKKASNSFLSTSLTSRSPALLNRSFSSLSSQSSKLKLTVLDATLTTISQELSALRLSTKEQRMRVTSMNKDYVERNLLELNNKLSDDLKKLEKAAKVGRMSMEERSKGLKVDISKMKLKSKELRDCLDKIATKIDKVQNAMGLYSGKEKHKI